MFNISKNMEEQSSNNIQQRLKIICVRPLKNCNHHILKNLVPDVPYMFYNNYEFKDNSVVKISEDTVPYDFYGENITIHAIVGMNGCGKSTIIEILLRLINNLAFKFIGNQDLPSADKLGYVKGLVAEFYYEKDNKYFVVRQIDNERIEWLDNNNNSLINDSKLSLQELFYSLVINYSHYAYDVNDYQGEIYKSFSNNCWLQSIFHKNDGYETPIVLNPYREDGDIEIRKENELSSARLTSLFIKSEIEGNRFHKKYQLAAFDLTLDEKMVDQKYLKAQKYWSEIGNTLSPQFDKVEFSINHLWTEYIHSLLNLNELKNINQLIYNDNEVKLAKKYLVYKTIAVIYKYSVYKDFFNLLIKQNINKINALDIVLSAIINRFIDSPSHITLKIRQTINFLRCLHFEEKNNLGVDDIVKKIKDNSKPGEVGLIQIMDLLPPPIFKNKIKLTYRTDKNRIARIELPNLSSGERQQLYSRSSLLYHLVNLDSIKDSNRIRYNNIEVILEEVELYYHPEFQREYVKSLIDSIKDLNLSPEKHIDICIVTHSPLILSDIPLENILFLDEGKPIEPESNTNTFGSNIFDLLKFNFFLKENAFGEFASDKMKEQFELLKKKDLNENTKKKIKEVLSLIGDEFVVKVLTEYLN